MLTQKKFYVLLSVACLAGYLWLGINVWLQQTGTPGFCICLFKHMTNLPCPACGTTRSAQQLLKGNITASLSLNPLGPVMLAVLLMAPGWMLYDVILKKATLFSRYGTFVSALKKRNTAIFFALLIIMNWIWNIYKGL